MKKVYDIIAVAALMILFAQVKIHAQADGAATPAPDAVAPPAAPAPGEAPGATPAPAPALTPGAEVKPSAVEVPAATPPALTAGEGNTISIALDSVPVNQVVQMFARAANANIVAPTLPSTNVTVHLENVPWDAALSKILDSVGLVLVKDESNAGIYSVMSKEEVGMEPMESDIIFLNYSTASNVVPVLQRMMAGQSNASVSGYSGANALIVRAKKSDMKQIKEIVEKLDKAREQVMIECKFVELNDQAIKDLGINWQSLAGWNIALRTPQVAMTRTSTRRNSVDKNFKTEYIENDAKVNIGNSGSSSDSSKSSGSQSGASSGSSFESTPPAPPTTTDFSSADASSSSSSSSGSGSFNEKQTLSLGGSGFSSFDAEKGTVTLVPTKDNITQNLDFHGSEAINALSAVLSADAFQATLSALQQNDGTEVVSNPKIIVASGQTALIHVGQNEPNIVARPQGDTGDRYSYELDQAHPFIEIGVKLYVTPVLNTSNNISIKIKPELSRKVGDKFVAQAGTSYPIMEIRQVDTEFNVASGHTVALGGLTQNHERETVKKIPVLGDIPIIGTYLFRHTHKEKLQDEVIIFITASSAAPQTLAQVSGIPEDAKLIHRHLAKKVEESSKAEEMAKKKSQKATLPK